MTNLVNTGIYIISPRAMEHVPENEEFDFAKDLFPRLLDKGEKLLGVPCDGYWCDIGTPKSYYKCCADALSGKLKIELAGGFEADAPDECSDPECKCMEHADCACADRARLMDKISSAFLELGADYSDGFRLEGDGYELRISPLAVGAKLRIEANANDTETARELAEAACALVSELEKRLD